MLKLNSTSTLLFISCLMFSIVNTALSQGTLIMHHTPVQGIVVNMANISDSKFQNLPRRQVHVQHPQVNEPGGPSTSQTMDERGNGTSGDSQSSSYSSPPPTTSFAAQAEDNFAPAYPHGAVSNNYIVSTSRYTIVVQNRYGTVLGQRDLYNFWSAGVTVGSIWENRIEFDPYTQRWIMSCFADEFSDTASVLVGISQTEDPMGNWNLFKGMVDNTGAYYCEFPCLGFNKNFVAITGERYTLNNNNEDSGIVFLFDKNKMINADKASYTSMTLNGTRVSVAATYDTLINSLYILGEWNNSLGQLDLIKISGNPGSEILTVASYPTSSIAYASTAPNFENFAPQLGTSIKFQGSDDRPTSLVYVNGNLWCTQTVFLPIASPTRSSIQWWQVDTTGDVLQLGLVDDTTGNLFFDYPSIAVNQNNDALIGYSVFSSQMYASCGYSLHEHTLGVNSTDSSYIYQPGGNSYVDTSSNGDNFWGGWSATVVDPLNNTDFWTIQMVTAADPNTWSMWWANVSGTINSVSSIRLPSPVSAYPNPSNGNFTITGLNSGQIVDVYNFLGQKMKSAIADNSQQQLNISSLPDGMYLVRVSDAAGNIVGEGKVVKAN